MIRNTMTEEQKRFAEENHNLIYAFLNEKRLKEDEYYDIVVFSYLDSVTMFLSVPKLKKYSFSTIAWKNMERALNDHYKAQTAQKRAAVTISLNCLNRKKASPTLEEILTHEDSLMADLETELLLHELASRVSKPQMDVIQMKVNGFGIRDIAREQKMTMKGVAEVLAGVREAVLSVCYD